MRTESSCYLLVTPSFRRALALGGGGGIDAVPLEATSW